MREMAVVAKETPGRRQTFGAVLREARGSRTQRDVVMAANRLGDEKLTGAQLSAYERGEYLPDVDRARVLQQVLGVDTLVELLGLPRDVHLSDTIDDLGLKTERLIEIVQQLQAAAEETRRRLDELENRN